MSNLYHKFDKWLGLKLYRITVKSDVVNARKIGYVDEIIPKIVWEKRKKVYKSYDLIFQDIEVVALESLKIKPLKGFSLWLNLSKARNSIADSVKKKHITFIDDNHVNYSNPKYGYNGFTTTVDDLARIFVERYRMGLPKDALIKIFREEYKKGVKK